MRRAVLPGMTTRKAKAPLTVSVQAYVLDGVRGYGIKSSARAWHAHMYKTEAKALKVAMAIGVSQHSIEVNVAYPAPFMWGKED